MLVSQRRGFALQHYMTVGLWAREFVHSPYPASDTEYAKMVTPLLIMRQSGAAG